MARFETSSDARFIAQLLAKAEPGETVTYEEMSEAIGRDVRRFARPALYTALRQQVRESRVFESVPNEGYKRLTDEQVVATQAANGLSRISRTARRTAQRVQAVNFDGLSNQSKIAHNTQLSMLGAVAQMTKPSVLLAVEQSVKQRGDCLPVGETLKLMTK